MNTEKDMREDIKKTVPDEKEQGQDKVQQLLDGLAKGECRGVKGATAYKIAEYAQQKGLV